MANRRLILCRFISLPSLVSSVYSLSTHTHGMCIHLNWQSSKEKGGEKRKAVMYDKVVTVEGKMKKMKQTRAHI